MNRSVPKSRISELGLIFLWGKENMKWYFDSSAHIDLHLFLVYTFFYIKYFSDVFVRVYLCVCQADS